MRIPAWNILPPTRWKTPLFELFQHRPHAAQTRIHACASRFRVVACGRRFGKTMMASAEAFAYALLGGEVWIVAPTYDLTQPLTTMALEYLRRVDAATGTRVARVTRSPVFRMEFVNGGSIIARTAENPRNLQGRALDLVVIDEAATIADATIWQQYLRPTLVDRRGHAILISTPKRMNWFWDLYLRGMQTSDSNDWAAFQMPTHENPYIARDEIELVCADQDEDTIRQEIYAEFLPEGGTVFRDFQRALHTQRQTAPVPGHQYAVGVDLAKYRDFTVIAVIDATTRMHCYLERFNRMDWNLQAERVESVARLFQAPIAIDATGNDHMCDHLRARGLMVYPIVFTPMRKLAMISKLSMGIEYDGLKLLADPHLIDEFTRFEYERTDYGNLRVRAPEGHHDDIVMALALAWELALPYTRSAGYLPQVLDQWQRRTR